MIRNHKIWVRAALTGLVLSFASACGGGAAEGESEAAAADYERGPHRGRMLRDGDSPLRSRSSRTASRRNFTSTLTATTSRSIRAKSN